MFERYLTLRQALKAIYGRGRKEPQGDHYGQVLVEVVSYVEVDLGADLHDIPELAGEHPDVQLLTAQALESAIGRGRVAQLVGPRDAVKAAMRPPGTFDPKNLRDLGFDDDG
jgi:hypothetical protein